HAAHRPLVARQLAEQLARLGVPQPRRAVVAGGANKAAVRREGDAVDRPRVATRHQEHLAGGGVVEGEGAALPRRRPWPARPPAWRPPRPPPHPPSRAPAATPPPAPPPPPTSRLPPGDTATHSGVWFCPWKAGSSLPVATPHRRTLPSAPAVTAVLPSGA